MALIVADRVKETTTTTGTGTLTLAGVETGFQSFSDGVGDGNTTYYCVVSSDGTGEWEVGLGTYTAAGTTLSRDMVFDSSNAGSAVNFSAGTKFVFVTQVADKTVFEVAGKTGSVTLDSDDIDDATTDGKALLTAASKVAQRTALELGTAATGDIGSEVQAYDADTAKTDVAQTFTQTQTFQGLRESVGTVSGTTPALSISGSRIKTWTLSGTSTPTAGSLSSGDALTLAVTHGAHAINWTNFTVVGEDIDAGGGVTFYETWKVGSTAYVTKVGSTA